MRNTNVNKYADITLNFVFFHFSCSLTMHVRRLAAESLTWFHWQPPFAQTFTRDRCALAFEIFCGGNEII